MSKDFWAIVSQICGRNPQLPPQ
jgi:hypothetical protein